MGQKNKVQSHSYREDVVQTTKVGAEGRNNATYQLDG